jgi:hypothetical protein
MSNDSVSLPDLLRNAGIVELGSNCGQPEEGIVSHQPSEGKSDDPATV